MRILLDKGNLKSGKSWALEPWFDLEALALLYKCPPLVHKHLLANKLLFDDFPKKGKNLCFESGKVRLCIEGGGLRYIDCGDGKYYQPTKNVGKIFKDILYNISYSTPEIPQKLRGSLLLHLQNQKLTGAEIIID
ncbi:MAG: hypothetical protein AB7I29_13425 [Geobacter sp.]